MARRGKKKAAGPSITKDEKAVQKELNKNRVDNSLNASSFSSVCRLCKVSGIDRVRFLRTATFKALRRLGAKRNPGDAIVGIPVGSDQGDFGTIVAWIDSIELGDAKSIKQLVAIDATLTARIKG